MKKLKGKGRFKRLVQWAFRVKCLPLMHYDIETGSNIYTQPAGLRAPTFNEAWNAISNT